MAGIKSLVRKIGAGLASRPEETATGVGMENAEAVPITGKAVGAPRWVSGLADALTSLGPGGPEAAQRQQQMRQGYLQNLAAQRIQPMQAALQAHMVSQKMKLERAQEMRLLAEASRPRMHYQPKPDGSGLLVINEDLLSSGKQGAVTEIPIGTGASGIDKANQELLNTIPEDVKSRPDFSGRWAAAVSESIRVAGLDPKAAVKVVPDFLQAYQKEVADQNFRLDLQGRIDARQQTTQDRSDTRLNRTIQSAFDRQDRAFAQQDRLKAITMRSKLNQFIAAKTALQAYEETLKEYTQASYVSDPIGTEKIRQRLSAQADGFTRIVGRALGEKGVFTDRDAENFRKIIGPGTFVTTVAPSFAWDRLAKAKEVLAEIGEAEKEFTEGVLEKSNVKSLVKPSGAIRFSSPSGKAWDIPSGEVSDFQKAHPEAVRE